MNDYIYSEKNEYQHENRIRNVFIRNMLMHNGDNILEPREGMGMENANRIFSIDEILEDFVDYNFYKSYFLSTTLVGILNIIDRIRAEMNKLNKEIEQYEKNIDIDKQTINELEKYIRKAKKYIRKAKKHIVKKKEDQKFIKLKQRQIERKFEEIAISEEKIRNFIYSIENKMLSIELKISEIEALKISLKLKLEEETEDFVVYKTYGRDFNQKTLIKFSEMNNKYTNLLIKYENDIDNIIRNQDLSKFNFYKFISLVVNRSDLLAKMDSNFYYYSPAINQDTLFYSLLNVISMLDQFLFYQTVNILGKTINIFIRRISYNSNSIFSLILSIICATIICIREFVGQIYNLFLVTSEIIVRSLTYYMYYAIYKPGSHHFKDFRNKIKDRKFRVAMKSLARGLYSLMICSLIQVYPQKIVSLFIDSPIQISLHEVLTLKKFLKRKNLSMFIISRSAFILSCSFYILTSSFKNQIALFILISSLPLTIACILHKRGYLVKNIYIDFMQKYQQNPKKSSNSVEIELENNNLRPNNGFDRELIQNNGGGFDRELIQNNGGGFDRGI